MSARPLDATPSVAKTLVAEARDPLFVAPSPRLARAVALAVHSTDDSARLLLPSAHAERLFGEFRAATAAADAVAEERLAVRTDPDLGASLTLGEERIWVHVRTDDRLSSLSTEDAGAIAAFHETFDARWENATTYAPDVPGRTALLESFGDRWPDAAGTFSAILEGEHPIHEDGPFDAVAACTLVGARHELFSIELGEWAREIGFSSRTEIARAKERLSKAGLVETKRVPAGVGRPRQQLSLAEEELASMDGAALVSAARDRLDVSQSPE